MSQFDCIVFVVLTYLKVMIMWDFLRDLVLFAQFKKLEKHIWRSVTFVKK